MNGGEAQRGTSSHLGERVVRERGGVRGLATAALLVAAGGFLGTLARYGVSLLVDDVAAWPLATLCVNVTGAFLLGLLLELLATRPTGRGRSVRLLAGTGFLGSFTTYSSFAVEAERLAHGGLTPTALGYVAVSLVAGLSACLAGIAVASRERGRVS